MASRNIIVIGASAGAFEVLKKLVDDLPTDLQASFLYIVLAYVAGRARRVAAGSQPRLFTFDYRKVEAL